MAARPPFPEPEDLLDWLPDDQLDALAAATRRFERATVVKGAAYVDAGRVSALGAEPGRLQATVQGTRRYQVEWLLEHGRWLPTCTCPVATWCKHAYAVAVVALEGDLEPIEPVAPAPAFRLGPPDGTALVAQLRQQAVPWARQQAVQSLLVGMPEYAHLAFEPAVQAATAEVDPDLRCWRVAREIGQRTRGTLPAPLEPWRERPDLAARLVAREREALARDLFGWAAQRGRPSERRLRVALGLVPKDAGQAVLRVAARLTTPRLRDAPRTSQQLQQLRSELLRDPGHLPLADASLLVWLVDHGMGGNEPWAFGRASGSLRSLLERVAGTPLAAWDEDLPDDLAARAGVTPGGPVRLAASPARIEPACVVHDGDVSLALEVSWDDGTRRAVDEVLLVLATGMPGEAPALVAAGGELSPLVAQPPPQLVTRFREAGGLPVPRDQRLRMLGTLAPHFPRVRETLAAHTRRHAVVPAVVLHLHDDDWLQIRVFAHDGSWRPGEAVPAGATVFEQRPAEGWSRLAAGTVTDDATGTGDAAELGAPPDPAPVPDPPSLVPDVPPAVATAAIPDDVWLDLPAPDAVDPVSAWVTALGARPVLPDHPMTEARRHGFWLSTARRGLEALADAWDRRPPGATWYGTARVRRLLDAGQRVRPVLRIESSGVDWFTVSAEWAAEGLSLTDTDLAALRNAGTRFVKLSSGWVRRETADAHETAAGLLADLGVEPGRAAQRVTVWQLAGARAETLDALARDGADAGTLAALAELRGRIDAFRGLPRVRLPRGLRATLRPYQRDGLDFLAWTASLGLGAVLADDMGLGKTVQALAWLLHLRAQDPAGGPALVVCPASVVHNWRREAECFAPGLRVLVLERGQERHALRAEVGDHDLVVTNYALLRHDADAWAAIPLRALVLDEAQNVKNPDAAVTRAVQRLEARHRLALTGTPLENRALDLWSIVECVNPGYLGPRAAFTARYDRADAPRHFRTLLAARLRPVLLRRLKSAVAQDLPERIEERRDCDLTPGQRRLYLAELRRSRQLVERLGDDATLARHRIDVLAALTRLRQICCHPALAGGAATLGSGKLEALLELLEPLLAEGHKVLVFSQFVECLKLVEGALRRHDVPVHLLTGATVKRAEVVRAFAEDDRPAVFLLSLKAGGTGLNLTAASYVVLFDPWWNPAVEAQAIDRTHRIGQTRTVIAYRLLARGTIEEKIWELQQRKAALVRDVLGEGGFGRALTRDDLAYLFEDDRS